MVTKYELKRQVLNTQIESDVSFDGLTLDQAISRLQAIKAANSIYQKVFFNYHYDYENVEVEILGVREESDEEYNKRIEGIKTRETNIKKDRTKADYAAYLRLKKKFEKKKT